MTRSISALPPTATPAQQGKYWPAVKWLLIAIIFSLFLYFGTLPVRGHLSDKYQKSGDQFLTERNYIAALLEYKKALILRPGNTAAKDGQELALKASTNVLELEGFLKKNGATDQLSLLEEAKSVPKDEVEAVKLSKELLDKAEYQLAILPAETATQMDKTYRDGWIYLGIANLQSSRAPEVPSATRTAYQEKAKLALEKAKALDPTYQPTTDLLAKVN